MTGMNNEKLILQALSWLLFSADSRDTKARELRTEIDNRLAELAGPTVTEVYGKNLEELTPPAGTVWSRDPKTGNVWFIKANSTLYLDPVSFSAHWALEPTDGPRLLLHKCKRLVFDIVDENRQVKPSDAYYQTYKTLDVYRNISSAPQDSRALAQYILSEPRVED